MRGWRIKLVFLLIVYFSGFATAIYTLAPTPENKTTAASFKAAAGQSSVFSALKSDEFAQSFNAGIHKCIDFGKEAALRTATFIKQKLRDKDKTASS